MSAGPGHVVATAGHVDHGKSALIRTLTGIEPDRWAEERRRGLTIDLGYAWTTLPSGREVGFVDVPGHERFVKNMLAGVGPVRLVLFVVAADEGWKPQSEEHLQILDVLGTSGGVVALTKADLAGPEAIARRTAEIGERLAGTVLEAAPVVACSSLTGEGMDELVGALDAMLDAAPALETGGRARLFVDRVFTIHGAGTVVTGTLTGGDLRVDESLELLPGGRAARVRGLQTHRRDEDVARPVSRVAANLAGLGIGEAERGDALVRPGQWRPTSVFEGTIRAVRGIDHALTARGAFKLHAGTAERDARIRLLGPPRLGAGEESFVRVTLSAPLVLDPGERFVLRDAGRRTTVAGGEVLDPAPPARPGRDTGERLSRRRVPRADLPPALVSERGAVLSAEVLPLTGLRPESIEGAERLGPWWVESVTLASLVEATREGLEAHHAAEPLSPGLALETVRRRLAETGPRLGPTLASSLADAVLERLAADGRIERDRTTVRLAGHRVSLGSREDDAARVEAALEGSWPAPPDAPELADGALVDAMVATGRLVRVAPWLVVLPDQAARAERAAAGLAARPEGMTPSAFRDALGTTRKYAIPLLEWLDGRGVTARDGDVRRPAAAPPARAPARAQPESSPPPAPGTEGAAAGPG